MVNMTKVEKVQCDSKQFLIDSFALFDSNKANGGSVKVYLLHNKWSVKQYCKQTGMTFKEGLTKFYRA